MAQLREFGCHLRLPNFEVASLQSFGVLLEKLGFDLLRIGDHTITVNTKAPYPHAHTMLTVIGIATHRIKLSVYVADPFRRHPVEIAQASATLDQLTNGRVVLGLGAGELMNLEPFGIDWTRPVTHLKEAIEIIELLWQADYSKPANYDGEVFSLRNAFLQIKPVQRPRPKILVGAVGTKTRTLAGRLADGWNPMPCESPATLKKHLDDVRQGAKDGGKNPEDLEVVPTIYTDVNEDYEVAFSSVESVARVLLVLDGHSLKLMGHQLEIPEDLSYQRILVNDKKSVDKLFELSKTIPRNIVESVVAAGSSDQCISKIEALLKAGATSMVICNLGPNPERTYRTYSEKIIPYLREQYPAN